MAQAIWPDKENLSAVADEAVLYADSLNRSCFWPDLNYEDRNISNWAPYNHMLRLTVMFQGLTAPGSRVQNHTKLSTLSRCALNVWLEHDWEDPNWWFNQIAIPLFATNQLLMLGDNATEFEREKIKNISYRANWWAGHEGTGANLVWMLQIQLYRSLATNNLTGIDQAFPRLWNDVAILPPGGQGMQQDLSYHFHGRLLLSGTYGQEWAVALLVFILSTQGTRYQIDQDRLTVFATFLANGDAWMTVGSVWDWGTIGRHVDRPHLERLTFITPTWLRSFAQLVQSKDISTKILNWSDRLEGRPDATPLVGNKHFFVSDFQVHRRANWSSSLKIQSPQTTPTECIIGENQKAEHFGQGVLNLWTNNIDDYVQIFPLLDWQAINGITVERGIPIEPCDGAHFKWTPKTFVGGASDAKHGLAIMDTHTHNLTALRSWHFYDDAIIALATNLTLASSNVAWTTLASRLVPQGALTVGFFNGTVVTLLDGKYLFPYIANKTFNVQWFHIGGSDIGYILQTQGQYFELGIDLGIKTNNYDTFSPFIYQKTARMLTAWIDHGRGPFTLDYQYMIFPNVPASATPDLIKSYEQENVFSCITSNDLIHGTAWPTLKRASFVLWNNDTTTSVTCNSPSFQLTAQSNDAGIYIFSETATDFSITASHPTRFNQTHIVTVNRLGSGQGCAMQFGPDASNTKVTLALPTSSQLIGQSVIVTCKKQQF